MPIYALLTRLSPATLGEWAKWAGKETAADPKLIAELGEQVAQSLKQQVPEAKWIASYAVLGPYDYLDIFEAPDNETAAKVAAVIRTHGNATTETWPLTPWDRFRDLLRAMGTQSM
ncbi:hypothetical protein HRbin26_01827 [bacterium HR26]|nr:hypothetical protein HRbin26_01827 [bacterium HR26]